MIHNFKIFESKRTKIPFWKKDIDKICRKYDIERYTIHENGQVSVRGDVVLNSEKLTKLPLRFKKVTGNFEIENNRLVSLEGCPEEVGSDFLCGRNRLESLEFCPKKVGGKFDCGDNYLKSLEFVPECINGDFICRNNSLTSLEFCPKIYGLFNCSNNELRSLKHLADHSMTIAQFNEISDLDGQIDGSNVLIKGNPVNEIIKLIDHTEAIYYLKEFDVIRDNNVIIRDRLEEVFSILGIEIPKIINLKYYTLK